MRCYTITCDSGTVALVRAATQAAAEKQWDAAAKKGDAEERIGDASPASRAEIRSCVEAGHDYR